MKFGRLSKPCAALIAVIALAATAQPAKADLYLKITDAFNSANTTTVAVTSSTQSVTFSGFTFNYSMSMIDTDSKKAITLNASVVSNGTFKLWNFTLSTDPAPQSPTAPGLFNEFAGGSPQLELTSSLTVNSISAGSSVQTQSTYNGYGSPSNQFTHTVTQDSPIVLENTGTVNSVAKVFNQMTGTDSIDLSSMSIDVASGGAAGSQVSFSATAAVGLPEPSGVAAAFAGLPCMGLLVRLARRRFGAASV